MTNPLKSQIAANRERFDEKFPVMEIRVVDEEKYITGQQARNKVKSFLTTSQTSLLQTAIAAVEGMKGEYGTREDKYKEGRKNGFNEALSKVVELLKGGIDN